MAFDDDTLFTAAVITMYVMCPLTFVGALFNTAPYGGRHTSGGYGFAIPAPLAWFLMESPTLWLTILLLPHGRHRHHPLAAAVVSLYLLHYLNRTILYPLRLAFSGRGKDKIRRDGFPSGIALMSFFFNLLNAYVQTRSAAQFAAYPPPDGWWVMGRSAAGAALFFWGMWVNVSSDRELLRLKAAAGGGYVVPRGGWFELVCCPNYMGEATEWLGWAVLAWSPAAFAFFLFTCSNLAPRARAHRRWYINKFGEEFPKNRKAIFPYLY